MSGPSEICCDTQLFRNTAIYLIRWVHTTECVKRNYWPWQSLVRTISVAVGRYYCTPFEQAPAHLGAGCRSDILMKFIVTILTRDNYSHHLWLIYIYGARRPPLILPIITTVN